MANIHLIFSVNLPSVNELSQMFPKLDSDLSSVASHFRFDHLVAENTANVDSADAKTPLQSTKPFSSMPCEQTVDDEDEERTLSTDLLANPADSKSEGVVSAATKLLEDIINKSVPKQQSESLIDISRGVVTRSPNIQIQKQSSLHGSESTASFSNLRQTDASHRFPRRNFEYSRFMSIDQRSISDTEDNVATDLSSITNKDSDKTQSCANIQMSCLAPRSPGAIVVKEKYIELPKQRAQSIRTPASARDQQEFGDGAKKSVSLTSSIECMSRASKNGPSKPRFTTTKVDESQLGSSALKKI